MMSTVSSSVASLCSNFCPPPPVFRHLLWLPDHIMFNTSKTERMLSTKNLADFLVTYTDTMIHFTWTESYENHVK